jgi:hypothetical protein
MLKESKTKAQGAVNMYDIADRIEQAIATGNVISGPLASASIKVRQVFDPQGKSKSIQETRKVIRALAEGTVNARKALEGQGSITEQESAVAAKAESGDIDDLTIGELLIIADLNKRAARLRVSEHDDMLRSAESDAATKSLVKYFKVKPLPPERKSPATQNSTSGAANGALTLEQRLLRYDKSIQGTSKVKR